MSVSRASRPAPQWRLSELVAWLELGLDRGVVDVFPVEGGRGPGARTQRATDCGPQPDVSAARTCHIPTGWPSWGSAACRQRPDPERSAGPHPCASLRRLPGLGRDLVRAAGRTAKPVEAPGTKKEPVPPRREATPARQTASGRAGRMPAVGKLLAGAAPLDLDELFRPVSQDVGLLDKIVSLVEVFREIGLHP